MRDYWGPACEKAGITAKRMINESVKNDITLSDPSLKDSAAAKYVDIIGGHLYDGGPFPYPLADSLNKPYWETEYGGMSGIDTSIGNAVMWASLIHDCLTRCKMNAFHFWWLVNNNTNDDEGLCNSDGLPTPRMFALGNFSKFIRPDFKRIAATDSPASGVKVSAYYGRSNSRLVIVAINAGSEVKLDFAISGVSECKITIPWITDSTHRLEKQAPMTLADKTFSYSMPSKSIVTFVMRDIVTTSASALPNKKPSGSPFKLAQRVGDWQLKFPPAQNPWSLRIVTPSGREIGRIDVSPGCRSIAIKQPNFAGIVILRSLQNGSMKLYNAYLSLR